MDPQPSFLKSIEIHSRKHNQEQKHLIHSFQLLLQEKKELEETHNKIVKKSIIQPSKNLHNNSKTLSKSKEFIRKKIHYINCPVMFRQESDHTSQRSQRFMESEILKEEDFSDLSFLTSKIPEVSHTFQTSIFYAEDLFGNKKPNIEKFDYLRRPRKIVRSNFNNSYTRTIAGSSAARGKKLSQEIIHDPLIAVESALPSSMRTLDKNSPWVYSSVLRTNTIFRVKCKSRG